MIDPKTLEYLGSGRNRDVYLLPGGRYVLKVPRNESGIHDNYHEHCFRYALDPYYGKTRCHARCRLIPGTYLLVMEYIEAIPEDVDLPMWADFIDCQQVGLDRQGRIRAYDFGLY